MNKTVRIAIYGKGGIGKSTIASNLTATLAHMGMKVLQIGCDPKADSTRLLMGRRINTVLEQLNKAGASEEEEAILYEGRIPGVFCIEAGGPSAGVGCAGMGITAMETELVRRGIPEMDWDVIVYDVLGDVVCGGFAVPMRKHFVDRVYIVSSSDYMSIYAANNILRAVDYYSYKGRSLFGGLIWNHCRDDFDRFTANSYSRAASAEITSFIEESTRLKALDFSGKLLVEESNDDTGIIKQFKNLAESMLAGKEQGDLIHPLSVEEMDEWRQSLMEEYNHGNREKM